jgi:hypothetical protein
MSPLEDLVRSALAEDAGDTTPSPEAWTRLQGALAARSRRRRLRMGAMVLGAAAAMVAIAAATAVVLDDGAERVAVDGGRADDRPVATTTIPPSGPTTITTSPPPDPPDAADPTGRPSVAVAVSEQNRVVVLDTATGRALRVLYRGPTPGPDGAGRVQSVSLSPDRRTVWFGVAGVYERCDEYAVHRVPLAGGEVERVATGGSPSVSPDGRQLAYAAHGGAHGAPTSEPSNCLNSVVIRDLGTGAERAWVPADDWWDRLSTVDHITWASDSRRLAFEQAYEGAAVAVIDTAVPGAITSADGLQLTPPWDWIESLGAPVWLPGDDRIAAVGTCCYTDDGPHNGETVALSIDAVTDATEELRALPAGALSLDVDGTGRHLLVAQAADRRLVMVGPAGEEEVLGQGFEGAVW